MQNFNNNKLFDGKWSPTPEVFFEVLKLSSYQLLSGTVARFVSF